MKICFAIALLLCCLTVVAQRPQLVLKTGMQSEVRGADISADGKLALTLEKNQTMILWEVKTGRQLSSFYKVTKAGFATEKGRIEYVQDNVLYAISYAGKVLAKQPYWEDYKTYKGRAKHYNYFQTGWHYNASGDLLTVPDEKIYTDIQIKKESTGEVLKTLHFSLFNYDNKLRYNHLSSDGKWLLAGSQAEVAIQEVGTGKPIFSFHYGVSDNYARLIDNADVSPDNATLVLLTAYNAIGMDVATKKQLWVTGLLNKGFSCYSEKTDSYIQFSTGSGTVILGTGSVAYCLDVKTGAIVSTLQGFSSTFFTYNHLAEKSRRMVIEENKALLTLLSWNLTTGSLERISKMGSLDEGEHPLMDSTGTNFFRAGLKLNVKDKGPVTLEEDERDVDLNTHDISADAGYDLVINDRKFVGPNDTAYNKMFVRNLTTGKIVWSRLGIRFARWSKTRNEIVALRPQSAKAPLLVLNGITGKVMRTIPLPADIGKPRHLYLSPNDRFILVLAENQPIIIEPATGKVIEIPGGLPEYTEIRPVAFTADEGTLAVCKDDGLDDKSNIIFFNIEKGAWVKTMTIARAMEDITSINFTANGRYLFTTTREKNCKLWDLEKDILLATLYADSDTDDWAVVTPDGKFDASEGAQKNINFVKGVTLFPLSALYEKFFVPRLLPRLLADSRFPVAAQDFDDLRLPPHIKISYQEKKRNLVVDDDEALVYTNETGLAELTMQASAEEDKVEEIRLFHNGKIVTRATRNLIVADATTTTESAVYTVHLLPGKNTFTAVALNSQRTESEADEITVNFKGGGGPTPPVPSPTGNPNRGVVSSIDKDATLHLIVVGINAYNNPAMGLNYALADATSFKDEIERDAKSIIATTKTYFVTDKGADKTGITNALAAVQKTAKPQDVFLFYYAGHGVIGKDKEFYLVPADVSNLKEVQTELEQKAIPSRLLQQYAIDIPAQKQLFILDACQSAGAFESLLTADGEQQKNIAVVARSTGTHWIAASGAQQFANEFSSLGHGAFTYVMLQALKGEAAANKMITVNGLKYFTTQALPALMKKYNGSEQYPASYGSGNDFPVEILK